MLVAVVHLKSKRTFEALRVGQIQFVIEQLTSLAGAPEVVAAVGTGPTWPVFVAGDFNSQPNGEVHKYMTESASGIFEEKFAVIFGAISTCFVLLMLRVWL